jgi:predicted nucleic acid-binding protein
LIGSPVFLDTVGLLALWDRSDQWHRAAVTAFETIAKERAGLYTSSLVLLECGNAAARRPYRASVAALWREMGAAGRSIQPTEGEWQEAWSAYENGAVGGPGVVDLISFRIMDRLRVRRAFTNDRHFRDAGFEVLF